MRQRPRASLKTHSSLLQRRCIDGAGVSTDWTVPRLSGEEPRAEDGAAGAQHGLLVRGRWKRQVGARVPPDVGARAGKRSARSLSWGGINNTYFWIDPQQGIAGVILMQFLPFADTKALFCTTRSSAACIRSWKRAER